MMRGWIRRRGESDANCMQVARVLQSYLDGETDDLTARRVSRHLENCRRCGLAAETYDAIKDAIARRASSVDADALARLREFSDRLAEEGPAEDSGSSA